MASFLRRYEAKSRGSELACPNDLPVLPNDGAGVGISQQSAPAGVNHRKAASLLVAGAGPVAGRPGRLRVAGGGMVNWSGVAGRAG